MSRGAFAVLVTLLFVISSTLADIPTPPVRQDGVWMPTVSRTSSLTQPGPNVGASEGFFNNFGADVDSALAFPSTGCSTVGSDKHCAPPLYFGNTFTINDIVAHNDSMSLETLLFDSGFPQYFNNLSPPGPGYKILLRVIGVVRRAVYNTSTTGDSWHHAESNGYTYAGECKAYTISRQGACFSQVLTSTPEFLSFPVVGNDAANLQMFSLEDTTTPKSINLWASNPSAYFWLTPASALFNGTDLWNPANEFGSEQAQIYPSIISGGPRTNEKIVELHWQVACQDASGGDCAASGGLSGFTCGMNLTAGASSDIAHWYDAKNNLCWQDVAAPLGKFNFFNNSDHFVRALDRIMVRPRPILLADAANNRVFQVETGSNNGLTDNVFTTAVLAGDKQTTVPIEVSLPLNAWFVSGPHAAPLLARGDQNLFTRRFLPGKDNTGGSISITVQSSWNVFSDRTVTPTAAGVTLSNAITLTGANSSALFQLQNIRWSPGVDHIYVFFQVTENAANSSVLNPTTPSADAAGGIYPNGAYSIPAVRINFAQINIQLKNFPPSGTAMLPISPIAVQACEHPAQQYVLEIDESPQALGLQSVTVSYVMSTPGLQFYVCSSAPQSGFKRAGTPPTLLNGAFVFTGDQQAISFVVVTPATPPPVPVTVGFNLATASPAVNNNAFTLPDNVTFNVAPNQVYVAISNGGLGSNDGIWVGEDFYVQFQWTPPTVTGFAIQISGLYTTWPDGTTGTSTTFTVPANSTGIVAGPFKVQVLPNLAPGVTQFDIPYTIALIAGAGTDNTWYSLSSAVQIVTIKRHTYSFLNDWKAFSNDGVQVTVWTTGQPTPPLCVFVSSLTIFNSSNDDVWITPVSQPAYLIFEPLVAASTGVAPNNSIVLNRDTPMACFTARFDTKQSLDTLYADVAQDITSPIALTVKYIQSGPGATRLQEPTVISGNPTFTLQYPTVTVELPTASGALPMAYYGNTYLAYVTVDVPPYAGDLNYNISLPGATVVPNAGTFSPGGVQQHVLEVTIGGVLPRSGSGSGITDIEAQGSIFAIAKPMLFLTGPNAALYKRSTASWFDSDKIHPRIALFTWAPTSLTLPGYMPEALSGTPNDPQHLNTTLLIGYSARIGSIRLQQPVLQGLTITPKLVASNDATISDTPPITFSPPSFTFLPGGNTEFIFSATGNLLGTYQFEFELTGADQSVFVVSHLPNPPLVPPGPPYFTVAVQRRPLTAGGMSISIPTKRVTAGVAYGPFVIQLNRPLLMDETLTITLTSTPDVQITPTNVVELSGATATYAATFGVRWVPNLSSQMYANPPPGASWPLLFTWSISGNAAWKYDTTGLADFELSGAPRTATITLDNDSPIIGVRYVGTVTLVPQIPAPAAINFLLKSSDSVTFFAPGSSTPMTTPMVSFSGPDDGTIKTFEYVINNNNGWQMELQESQHKYAAPLQTDVMTFLGLVDASTPGSKFFINAASTAANPRPRRVTLSYWPRSETSREFYGDNWGAGSTWGYNPSIWKRGSANGHINNLFITQGTGAYGRVFMVNHPSPPQTLTLTTPPTNGALSVTISHPSFVFTPATIQFAVGQLTAQFTMTATTWQIFWNDVSAVRDLNPNGPTSPGAAQSVNEHDTPFDIRLSGPDAQYYVTDDIANWMKDVLVVPDLGFSPIPAMPIDGEVSGLSVWLNNVTSQFTFADDLAFVLQPIAVYPESSNWPAPMKSLVGRPGLPLVFEPSTLQFTKKTVAAGAFSQQYSIRITSPALLQRYNKGNHFYVHWLWRIEGNRMGDYYARTGYWGYSTKEMDLTSYVPEAAQVVPLKRYQIEPIFPSLLDFSWQDAAFNITRGPLAPMTFIPHQAVEDGSKSSALYRGRDQTAGGRIVFDPAVIAFAPGQTVSEFKVKAIPGTDQQEVYYRVQWQISGQPDDLFCYYDYIYARSDSGFKGAHFSTWHIAPASTLMAPLFVVLLSLLVALVL